MISHRQTPACASIHLLSTKLRLPAALFVCNRVVDVSFILDMVLQALMGFWDKKRQRWESSLGPVLWRYCRTWLLLDIISAAPFDVVAMLLSSQTLSKFKVSLGPDGVSLMPWCQPNRTCYLQLVQSMCSVACLISRARPSEQQGTLHHISVTGASRVKVLM